MSRSIAKIFLSCGGIGFLPKGSWITALLASFLWSFSAAALPPSFPLRIALVLGLGIVLFTIGALAVPLFPKEEKYDRPWIVLDEVLGTLISASPFLLIQNMVSPFAAAISTACVFGFFDGFKPLGIRRIDERDTIPITVMLDDVVAGVYAAAVIFVGITLSL